MMDVGDYATPRKWSASGKLGCSYVLRLTEVLHAQPDGRHLWHGEVVLHPVMLAGEVVSFLEENLLLLSSEEVASAVEQDAARRLGAK